MTHSGVSARTRRTAQAVMALVAVAAVVTALRPELGEMLGFPLMLVGYLVASYLFVRGATAHDGRERLAWRLIGVALFIGAAGILSFLASYVLGHDIPAFGYLDIFFLAAYSISLAGLWVLPHFEGVPIRRMRIFIDGLVGAVSIGVLTWVWFLDDILEGVRNAPLLQVVVGSAYPLLDVATLVVVVVVTVRRSTLRFDPRVLLLGAALLIQSIADLIYLSRGLGESFADADPVYPLFLGAVLALVLAGLTLQSRPPAREYAERRTPWWAMLAPYGAAVALVGMLMARMLGDDLDTEVVEMFLGVLVVVSLIIVRQTLAIRENRELVERQRTALVSSISHELRTPLTAMVGFLDILSDSEQHIDPGTRQEMVDIVDQQANYMARIVSDLVMLNRADPDLHLQESLVAVADVVTAAQATLDIDSAPGVDLEIAQGLVAHVDPARMQQVAVNLLTNAARYGGPHRLVVGEAVGDDLVLEFHDDGPGVPKRYELVIWDRFERGSHRYNAGVPGSGIGLSIVAMLVNAHQGFVGYRRSERLGGACFAVTLPGRARIRSDRTVPLVRPPVIENPARAMTRPGRGTRPD